LFALALVPVLGVAVWVFNVVDPAYSTLAAMLTLLALLVLVVVVCLRTPMRDRLPPELRAWMVDAFTGEALKQITGLAVIYYIFIAVFWSLWDQSNGQTWTLQATSDLMDKHLFGFLAGVPGLGALARYEMLPAQIQVVNGLFILGMVPIFTFAIYPAMGRFFTPTPLRKIGIGLWVIASSFLIIAYIENRIMHGHSVSLWWQILAYVVLTAAEVLISITSMEFAYMQAPLKVKSFIMAATYLLAISIGNAFTAQVNTAMVKPLVASDIAAGDDTWVTLADVSKLQPGQKIDFDGDTGIEITDEQGQKTGLAGTFIVGEIDQAHERVRLEDAIHRKSVASTGAFKKDTARVSTYKLVGPMYFLFFAAVAALAAIVFIFVAGFYKERTHVRPDETSAGAASGAPAKKAA
jgi:POT family proton-dependent oligopeptide transporter